MAKALGTGLPGRPNDFEALAAKEDGDFLIRHGPSGDRMVVHTARVGPFLVAFTSAHDKEPPRCDAKRSPGSSQNGSRERTTPRGS